MFEWGSAEKLSVKNQDRLADLACRRFREAVDWQASERIGDRSLRQVLQECHDQFHGVLTPGDQKMVELLGVDAKVNLTAMKAGVVHSFLSETIIQADSLPWVIASTPIPSLSDRSKREALEMVKAEIFDQGYEGDLLTLIKLVKEKVKTKEKDSADQAARAMERLMHDQCVEGGWRNAMYAYLSDFVVYPFAVMQGPVPTRRPRLTWTGDNLAVKNETFYEFRPVSVFDFWYSPDSPDTQRGTGVFLRQRWTRQRLLEASRMKSYFSSSIEEILKEAESADNYIFKWMSDNPDQPDSQLKSWVNCTATIDVLIHYGYFSGRELDGYGIGGLDPLQFYNTTLTVIGGRTVQVFVAPNPTVAIRPVHTASFYKTHDRIPSFGIAQRLRDVERCFLATLRYLMRNVANASEPITEADYSRLIKHMAEEDLTKLEPGAFFLADNDIGANVPALRFHTIPSVVPQYRQVLDYFMELAHYVTNIPAALHGTAVGSGANRTFRGAAMLQGNAVKAIQSAVGNIDQSVFFPCGELLFNYNMLYEKNEDIKGDCQVLPQGVQGLLAKEMDRNNAMELLQLVGAAGAQLGDRAPGLFAWSMNKLMSTMGVPDDLLVSPGLPNGLPPASGAGLEGGVPPMPAQQGVMQ